MLRSVEIVDGWAYQTTSREYQVYGHPFGGPRTVDLRPSVFFFRLQLLASTRHFLFDFAHQAQAISASPLTTAAHTS
jgi:hypothetical protein